MYENWQVVKDNAVFVKIIAQIKNNETQEIREYETDELMLEGEDTPHTFIWEDGNYSCDCNRTLFFLRAKDEEEPEDPPCSEGKYSVRLLNAKDRQPYYSEFDK